MEELDFDPRTFCVYSRVWHVVDGTDYSLAEGTASGGRPYVPVFTDRDLAERFIGRAGNPNAMALEMATMAEWLRLLEKLVEVGYEYIAPDPEPNQQLRITTIPRLINVLRDAITDQEAG